MFPRSAVELLEVRLQFSNPAVAGVVVGVVGVVGVVVVPPGTAVNGSLPPTEVGNRERVGVSQPTASTSKESIMNFISSPFN